MKVILNSKETSVPDGLTVTGLKRHLSLPDSGIAIAVNSKIILAPNHDTFILSEGDDIIIIGAAYGG